ncbi:putative B3 domain-containing protein Os04g0346900 [Neltuma alba]|uniref:putative B3 domain-containing protein Os04g0346900 n=1 Tax=Neltuma alba TaxID=207710 RepID=UPI0010A4AF0D|nr:putative B3 domain-containing protein Os04g0346900 [Prosopis alba]
MGPRRRNFVRPLGSPADAESSHFLKIILPETIRAQKLRIPKEFARRYENELSTGEATIGIPDGCIWRMELKKSENEVCFGKGWREFVKYYSIKFGFILAFKYEGNSHFSLVIFDVSAAEIHYPLCKDNSEKQNLESKCPGKKSSFNHCSYNTRRKRHELEDQEEIIDIDCANDLSPGKLGNNKSYNSAENSRKQERNRSGPGRSSKMMKKTLSRKQRAIRAAQISNQKNHPLLQ